MSLRSLLSVHARDLAKKPPIVSLDDQDSVAQALSTLSKAQVISAPLVVGPPALAFEGRPPVSAVAAFVGVADVLDALLDALPFEEAEGVFDAPLPTEVERAGSALGTKTLSEAFGASTARGAAPALERVPASGKLADEAGTDWCLKRDDDAEPLTLLSAISDGFLRPLGGAKTGRSVRGGPLRACHRIALFNNDGGGKGGEGGEGGNEKVGKNQARLSGLLSQSDAVAWLFEASASSPALRRVLEDTPAAASGDSPLPRLLTVPATATALAAFRALRAAGASGAAVVEEGSGVLLGSLSASDARYLQAGLFGALCVPVTTFLAERRLLAAAARASEAEARDSVGLGEAELSKAVEEACKSGAAMAGALGGGGGGVPAPAAVGSGRVVAVPQFEEEKGGGGGGGKKRPTSLCAAAAKMAKERVHRCWVVSREGVGGVVVGCVTATDVLLAVQRAVEAEEAAAAE